MYHQVSVKGRGHLKITAKGGRGQFGNKRGEKEGGKIRKSSRKPREMARQDDDGHIHLVKSGKTDRS